MALRTCWVLAVCACGCISVGGRGGARKFSRTPPSSPVLDSSWVFPASGHLMSSQRGFFVRRCPGTPAQSRKSGKFHPTTEYRRLSLHHTRMSTTRSRLNLRCLYSAVLCCNTLSCLRSCKCAGPAPPRFSVLSEIKKQGLAEIGERSNDRIVLHHFRVAHHAD